MILRTRALAATLLLTSSCLAQAACPTADAAGEDRATIILRSDNDLYGREGQDQGYTNGFFATYVSPNLDSFTEDPCLPPAVRWVNRALGWLQPRGAGQKNVVLSFSHGTYTPTEGTRGDLILDDRPYAAVGMFGVGYHGRDGNRLSSTHLRLGMVGPSAQGKMGQDALHRWFGRPRFQGWGNQVRDEVLVQLLHERLWRRSFPASERGWRWDAIGHVGGSLGNQATYANAGGELRFGKHLPDDFGTDPLRPAGENSAPGQRDGLVDRWRWHLFVGLDARWVLHDVTLDGNTSKDSHSVVRRDGVADLSLGIALTRGPWKIAGSHVRRTREFQGQLEAPVFGTLSFSRSF